ncbi:MbcA/ParS/Xre antitoxin family protein [Phaeobacter gallaeciensis]|uniref:MbcA/ParS/Xre antitoxin family protein n=1 Tax=Phaeobacter gallaeciensis TaxID=60890 RepID=UPI00237FAA1C|nr:MbcA/ParS/Xre antitoxin family protein [Phaeobacter gallaeciensis]MDE4142874.1 MbcA/ParS/Xre antitoxin family protein [Phaeobacter gallaeciensis]MDE4151303.1 MbcA/ParS/Xre antitoxin family protein [Phaeobacter gallaeciensis]MDE4155530.1 MbcA/ParS/Xre antitoxin family protein [Phaeobacter gallaeciensis]MDE4230925.1 MbcA/ParS/Xre antitoxin family protein [Phaeobacter gallaeciensis]MDE4264193.1 MbcA/ParS/Xre antitoxin family protein [Phaeobacter gallaeciensis]
MPELRRIDPHIAPMQPQFSGEEVQAMQRAFVKLAELWGLSDEQASVLMGDISVRTFRRWKAGELGRAGIDTAARLSNLIGIHKALRLLFKDPARGYGWVKRPNEAFGGTTALDVMLNGQITDIMRVRRYLDAMRGPW